MTSADQTRAIEETAFAKINLDLRVVGRRSDGYHDLDSVVAFARFGDRLRFLPADGLTISIEGPFQAELSHETDNLVLRAARALALMAARPPAVHIIPVYRPSQAPRCSLGSNPETLVPTRDSRTSWFARTWHAVCSTPPRPSRPSNGTGGWRAPGSPGGNTGPVQVEQTG